MTDELTPQEQEALKSLPRERMPAGLEARVTEAMREHGFLERRRRTIAITSSRVAGLMAACVALVIGAYSIGLHRGGVDQALPGVELSDERTGGRTLDAVPEAPAKKELAREKAPMEIGDVRENEPTTVTDDDRSDAAKSGVGDEASPVTAPPARSNEEKSDRFRQVEAEAEGLARSAKDGASPPPAEAPAPRAMLSESADRVQSRPEGDMPDVSHPPLRFLLNGSRVLVDAPDSVRVVKDEQRRMLLIYTSDGVIRIQLEHDR